MAVKEPSVTSATIDPSRGGGSGTVRTDESEAVAPDAAVLQSVPERTAALDIPTQKPQRGDTSRRTDGGRTRESIATPPDETNDGKAVLTGELAEKVAGEQPSLKEILKEQMAALPDAHRRVLDNQTPALAMRVLERALEERGQPNPETKEEEAWIYADLADDVQLNGRTFRRGRGMVPKALVEAFPGYVKEIKLEDEE